MNLTDGEVAGLQSCCLSMSLSTDDETAAAIFFGIMTQPPVAAEGDDIALFDASGQPIGSLKAFLGDALQVHASIVGCVHLPLCSLLQSLESRCELNVEVYHAEGQRNHLSAQYLRSVWPFLHRPWFHPYCVRRKPDLAAEGLTNANVAIIDVQHPTGERTSHMLVPTSSHSAFLFPFPQKHMPARSILFAADDEIDPLKLVREDEGDYIQYLRYLQDLERNHRCFLIKADICLNMIPAEIQLRALLEGPMHEHPGIEALLEPMVKIERERYENNRNKKKPQYYLHTLEGLRAFMETGVETDHFWGFRPFTPRERHAILSDLYERAAHTRYTHLFLLKPGITLIPDEIGWYEDRGICFLLPHTHYQLGGEHSELLFRDPEFGHFFSGYFRNWLCDHHAYSEDVSLQMLKELLEEFSAAALA